MKFQVLLFVLSQILKVASFTNAEFKKYISKTRARVLIKTGDGRYGRLFVFDRGKVSSRPGGNHRDFDVALVWQDANTAFSVMTSKAKDASFNAAAEGRLQVAGMSVYALWFESAVKLIVG